MRIEEDEIPKLWSARNFGVALLVHLVVFAACYVLSLPIRRKETVIPIDLTVVVHENLDGNENEPPPLEKPKAPPPPKPVKAESPPKVEDSKVEAVEKVAEKKKPVKKPETKKKEEPKKPEPPKKSKAELMKERREQMLKEAKLVKSEKRQPNGKTAKKTLSDKEVQKLLNQGYRPGKSEQLAGDEVQRCISIISRAFYAKWERPAWSSSLKEMILEVQFGAGGKVTGYRLVRSSGDASADQSVLGAASRVGTVLGLSSEFLEQNRIVQVRFKVTPQ